MKDSTTTPWLYDPGADPIPLGRDDLLKRLDRVVSSALIPRCTGFAANQVNMPETCQISPDGGPLLNSLLRALRDMPEPAGRRSYLPSLLKAADRVTSVVLSQAHAAASRMAGIQGLHFKIINEGGPRASDSGGDSGRVDTKAALSICPGGPEYLGWVLQIYRSIRGRHATELRQLLQREAELQDTDQSAKSILHEDLQKAPENIRRVFDSRPGPDRPWPWRIQRQWDGYRPEDERRPAWPFARQLGPEDMRHPAWRLRREANARRLLGQLLDATDVFWLDTGDEAVLQEWEVIRDAGCTLVVTGALLELIADQLELQNGGRKRCKVCGRFLRKEGTIKHLHCELHANRNDPDGEYQGERTDSRRLQSWGQRRAERWDFLAWKQGGEVAACSLAALESGWNRHSFDSVSEIKGLLKQLEDWTGDVLYQRLLKIVPIWMGMGEAVRGKEWFHPMTLFGTHFAGIALMNDPRLDPGKNVTPSGDWGDVSSPSDRLHTLAFHSWILRHGHLSHLDKTRYAPADLLCDLLNQRAWIECEGADMDRQIWSEQGRLGRRKIPQITKSGRPAKIDQEDAAKLRQVLRWSKAEIAAELQVSRAAVTKFFKRHPELDLPEG